MKQSTILLFLIVVLAGVLRFWQLGVVPQGVTHDELGYIYNSYSIATTGKNVFGQAFPFMTWMVKDGFPFMPIPIYMSLPIFWLLPLSAFSGRFMGALLGTADILLIFWIVKSLNFNKTIALLSALLMAISPWHIHFARTAYDPNYSLFFYLLFIATYLFCLPKKILLWITAVPLALAIYSYRGMIVIAPPLVAILFIYGWIKKAGKENILYLMACGLVFISLVLVIQHYGRAFVAEAVNVTSSTKSQEFLDTQIRNATGPLWLRRLFLNKPTNFLSKIREQYLRTYSTEYLFLFTEPSKIYSIWSRGRLYGLDSIFILLGVSVSLWQFWRGGWLILALLMIGGFPGGIGGLPYSARNLFLASVFPILTAQGILLAVRKLGRFMAIVIAICYMYLLGGYLFDYYFRYSPQQAEAWAKSLRDVSNYATVYKLPQTIVETASFGDVVQYAFWNHIPAKVLQNAWGNRKQTPVEIITMDGVQFIYGCADNSDIMNVNKPALIISRASCQHESTPSAQIRDWSGNSVWQIYQDLHPPNSPVL